jgi:hypothetical protein
VEADRPPRRAPRAVDALLEMNLGRERRLLLARVQEERVTRVVREGRDDGELDRRRRHARAVDLGLGTDERRGGADCA